MTDKERFCEILKATGRPGVDKVLAGLEELGFFAAPAISPVFLLSFSPDGNFFAV